jgi:hypothetical protein
MHPYGHVDCYIVMHYANPDVHVVLYAGASDTVLNTIRVQPTGPELACSTFEL